MERLVYRSTSITDLQAELRQQDLRSEAERRRLVAARAPRRRTSFLGLSLPGRGPRP